MARILVGLDIESVDPLLKTAGWSWKYNQGYVLNTALYYEDTDEVKVIAGLHNDNCPYSEEERKEQNKEIIALLKNPDVSIVGANLQYDLGFLLHEYGMSTYDVKCSFIDVLQAEAILNEFDIHNLEEVSWKYLKYGKTKDAIEEWVHSNVAGARGDFRKYLKEAPWDLLCEYIKGDAKNPVKVWRKQLTLLKEQDLCARCKLEFDCILPTLQITMNGYPIDVEQKHKNCELLISYRDKLKADFEKEYGVKNFNVNSSRNIASLCDRMNISYRCKITLKGENGEKFHDYKDTDSAFHRAKNIVSSFRFVKSVPVAYVPSELAERTVSLLEEEGFICTCSPNVDKNFFAGQKENYPIIALIASWKLANGIISKLLGEEYDRFICPDNKVRAQFNITNTVSFRYSSNKPNGQQIPSKGGFTVKDGDKDIEVSFPKLTRALFTAYPDEVLAKIDFSQEEYRLICHCAVGEGSEEVRKMFNENPLLDFHQYVVDLTGLTRKYAKNMSFGVSYGMGLKSMAESFGWTMEKATEISEQYHHHMPFVAPTLECAGEIAKKRGYIRTVGGSHARLPNPNKSYTMLNRFCQGSSAEILKIAFVNSYEEGLWEKFHMINTVHDEVNISARPTEDGIRAVYEMANHMATAVKLRVPLVAEPEFGMNWQDVKTVPEWLEVKEKEPDEWNKLPAVLKEAVINADKVRKDFSLLAGGTQEWKVE